MVILKTRREGIAVYILAAVDMNADIVKAHGVFLSEAGARTKLLEMGLSPAKIRVVTKLK